ncbi:putative defense protein [Schistocerca piceifrons]|uniref:putative defense protein n=1 Tax=Schistocerca piceifrons TaxID=274613 RepID=UPI001F5F0734|nr:putative defense protein [Schistocerca piceifrons]
MHTDCTICYCSHYALDSLANSRMKLVVATVLLMASAALAAPASPRFDHRPVLPSVCKTMRPLHGNAEPRTDPSPYTITAAPTSVNGGDIVKVHISGVDEFLGVYLQARRGEEPVGEFVLPSGETKEIALTDCPPGHKNAYSYISYTTPLSTLDIDWKAPNDGGEIVFTATFVKSYSEFWVGVTSPKITVTKVTSTDNAVAA